MNYQETLTYLFNQLPMFQRVGAAAYKANLDNTIALLKHLNNPENGFKSIHVAGTNGKGSTSHLLASVFQSAGYKTGLYTSPHLKDFRERIKINGECIPEEKVVDFVSKNKAFFEDLKPSFFEMSVGLAFEYFTEEKVDIAIIEVGLGGRLDSTNVIKPELSVITNIDLDHVALLGDTKTKIAIEKAGIIKPETPVVIGETDYESAVVFAEKAHENNAPIIFADQSFYIINTHHDDVFRFDVVVDNARWFEELECPLNGEYQEKNVCTALAALYVIQKFKNSKIQNPTLNPQSSILNITDEAIRAGFRDVVKNTGLLGRWQTIGTNPLTICDTGHNPHGVKEVLKSIARTPHKHLHIVWGMVNDKDISSVLALLPKNASYYFCKADLPRAINADDLQVQAAAFGLQGNIYSSVAEALADARKTADIHDLVIVGGSTFVVAEVV